MFEMQYHPENDFYRLSHVADLPDVGLDANTHFPPSGHAGLKRALDMILSPESLKTASRAENAESADFLPFRINPSLKLSLS